MSALDRPTMEAIEKIVSKALPKDELYDKHENTRLQRVASLTVFLVGLVKRYCPVLGLTGVELLEATERRRNYWAVNFYQQANFPDLDKVAVYQTCEEFWTAFPSKQFRCPACRAISTHPTACNSGELMFESDQVCDWKAYGLFGTLGKGFSVVVLEDFKKTGNVVQMFAPIELESHEQPSAGTG